MKNPLDPTQTPMPVWKNNLRSPDAWKKTLKETIMWVLFTCIIFKMLEAFAPGYPFVVYTPSIQEGIYWRDRTAVHLNRGDITSFEFVPTQAWLKDRYWTPGRVHTKRIAALAGDTVYVDAKGNIKVCLNNGGDIACSAQGVVLMSDTAGRPMQSWIPLGSSYTLKQGEAWMMGEHPKSLDSRYEGPIPTAILWGRAHLLMGWGE